MANEQHTTSSFDFQEGELLLIDKPLDWTSFDVVNKVRYRLKKLLNVKKIKVGHAGTLDPRASGLLIICTGRMTKQIDNYQGMEKEYTGTILLGATTPSYDSETAVDATFPTEQITAKSLHETTEQFTGTIAQKPPIFSAIKVNGQPLYRSARKGEEVEIKTREVTISSFKITTIKLPEVAFEVRCSKGTYIRSLAYDYGKALQSGGYLTALRRTKIGKYAVEDAWNLEALIEHLDSLIENTSHE